MHTQIHGKKWMFLSNVLVWMWMEMVKEGQKEGPFHSNLLLI